MPNSKLTPSRLIDPNSPPSKTHPKFLGRSPPLRISGVSAATDYPGPGVLMVEVRGFASPVSTAIYVFRLLS